MRKKFLLLALVATMALAGTTAPAFAFDDRPPAPPATVSVTCTITVTTPNTATITNTITLNVPQQVATYLTSIARSYTNPLTHVTFSVICK
jgi:hypothetical protein